MKREDPVWLPLRDEPGYRGRAVLIARLRRYLTTALFLLIGLATTALMYTAFKQNDSLRAERQFEAMAVERVGSVAKTMSAYVWNLIATNAFFNASEFVSRREFRLFVEPLLEAQPGIHAIEWIPRVPSSAQESYRRAARADGHDFQIKSFLTPAVAPTPKTDEDSYPVFYVEPFASNAIAFGIDVASDSIRREALERARDTAKPAATMPIPLVQDPSQQLSTLVFVPHYSTVMPPGDVMERRKSLEGFLLGAFRLSDLLAEATSYFDPSDINVALFDETRWLAGTVPADESDDSAHATSASALEKTEALEMGGRHWQVRCTSTADFLAAHTSMRPMLAMLSGLAATLLVTGYFYATTRGAEIRAALAQSEERYRTLVEHAPEAILVVGVDQGRFIDCNENACRMFKRSREELKTLSLLDISAQTQPDGMPTADAARSYLQRALDGEAPVFLWTHTDGEGNEIPCEIRLVRLPSKEHAIVRGSITDITDRVRIEEHQRLMMRELDHRVKNNLATVLSITEQSASDATSVEELRRTLASRIHAMADIHRALAEQRWTGMEIAELIRITLAPYRAGTAERIRMSGVPLTVGPEACSALSMVVHELATNAAKHGALSDPRGRVELAWRAENDGVTIDWTESGGPPVEPPGQSGYGTRLITGLIEHQLGGRVDVAYPSEGLRCRIWIPLKPQQGDAGATSLTS